MKKISISINKALYLLSASKSKIIGYMCSFWRFYQIHTGNGANGNDIIHVDPSNISFYLVEGGNVNGIKRYRDFQPNNIKHKLECAIFPQQSCRGLIISGDWDIYKKKYKYNVVYKGLYSYINKENKIEKTEYYDNLKLKEKKMSNYDADERFEEALDLYKSIKTNGYNPSREIFGKTGGNIGINIGRNGELIFNCDSHHRLAICKILNLKLIPVLVVVRHKEWENIRKKVRQAEDNSQLSPEIKKYLDHPDIVDIA